MSAAFFSLNHGANDAQKTMGIIAGVLFAGGFIQTFDIPFWVVIAAHSAIGLGTLAAGLASTVALHPGVGFAEPRIAAGETTPSAQPASYTIDPTHCGISFEITHLGIAKTHGRFNKCSGKIRADAQNLGKSSVEFTAQVDSLDTALAMRDEHLRGAEFFDVARYPEMTFKSTQVARAGDAAPSARAAADRADAGLPAAGDVALRAGVAVR